MEEKRYEIYIGNEFLREETGIMDAPVSGLELVLTFSLDTFARLTAGGPCICRKYVVGTDGQSTCVKWNPAGCGDAPFKVRDGKKAIPSTALKILDLSKKGFVKLPMDSTQKTIETQINSVIGRLVPPSIPGDTDKKLKCKNCGGGRGLCVLGGCFTLKGFPPTKGSLTWTF